MHKFNSIKSITHPEYHMDWEREREQDKISFQQFTNVRFRLIIGENYIELLQGLTNYITLQAYFELDTNLSEIENYETLVTLKALKPMFSNYSTNLCTKIKGSNCYQLLFPDVKNSVLLHMN